MFKNFHNIARAAKKMSMNKLIKFAVQQKDIQDKIVWMNTIEQLYEEGIDSKGLPLGEYSDATIHGTKNFAGKIEKGQRYDHITLSDSKDFYNSFKVVPSENSFVIDAETMKGGRTTTYNFDSDARGNPVLASKTKTRESDLELEYGKNILGLTDENLREIIGDVKGLVTEKVRKDLFA